MSTFLYKTFLEAKERYILDYYYFITRLSQIILYPFYYKHKLNMIGYKIDKEIFTCF